MFSFRTLYIIEANLKWIFHNDDFGQASLSHIFLSSEIAKVPLYHRIPGKKKRYPWAGDPLNTPNHLISKAMTFYTIKITIIPLVNQSTRTKSQPPPDLQANPNL